MSDVTSVPAAALKVSFGSRIAPRRSALCAIYFRTLGFSLSSVPFARNEGNHAAGSHLIQGAGEEIVMDEKVVLVIALVRHLELPEGDIADCGVKEAVGKICILEALHRDAVFLIELLGDPPRNTVQLHAVELRVIHAFGGTSPIKFPMPQEGSSTLPV